MKPPSDHDLASLEAEARRLVNDALPRVLEELRGARREADALRDALEKEKAAREEAARQAPPIPARARAAALAEDAEAAGALLAAPFRVSAKAAAAARGDPLAALAVQVAKALSPDAGPVERARLIAMAFAASQGDLEAFWAARKQRKAAPKPNRATPLRKK